MDETKTCARCGHTLPTEEFYKVKYKTGVTKYSYNICRRCIGIEQRRRYLVLHDPSNPLLLKIDALYEKHRRAGRSVPDATRKSRTDLEADIDELLEEEEDSL